MVWGNGEMSARGKNIYVSYIVEKNGQEGKEKGDNCIIIASFRLKLKKIAWIFIYAIPSLISFLDMSMYLFSIGVLL